MGKMAVTGGAGFIGSNLSEYLAARLGYNPSVSLKVLDWYRNQSGAQSAT